jgi:hypothetical protein
MTNDTATISNLLTPKQLVERHRWLTMGTLRKYLFHRMYNGLAEQKVVIALSQKKLLIDEARFINWVRSHGPTC